jgi:peptidyl-prolyl cis-trans isomerase C
VVDQKLLAAEAVKRKLDRNPEVQRRLDAARERVLGDAVVQSVVSGAVNESAVRGLYAEQQKLAKVTEEIRARQIVLATLTDADAVKKLLASGASFEALAMERSIDAATRFNGGDLGYFTTDVMPPAYDEALRTAKVGDVAGPVQVDGGWALMKVEDRRLEAPISLDAARPQIVRFLTYDQIRDLLEKLRGRAKIQSLLPAQPPAPGQPKEPASAPPPGAAPPPATAAPAAPATPAPKSSEPAPSGLRQ